MGESDLTVFDIGFLAVFKGVFLLKKYIF